jgi:Bacterial pre-peptidase C-terminal domain
MILPGRLLCGLVVAVLLVVLPFAGAEPKKPDAKPVPRVILAQPFGAKPGAAVKVTLRGLLLDTATVVRCLPKGEAKILKKGKVGVPDKMEPTRVGDTTVEAELTIPADVPGEMVTLIVEANGVASNAHSFLVDRVPPVPEKEPNNGFKEAQAIALGSVIEGSISGPSDVDVYRFEGKAGQTIVLEVHAARLGSVLDSFLTLYDPRGEVLETSDDMEGSTDSRIEFKLPRDGVYYAGIVDAHDKGGPLHGYRLLLKGK